MTKPKKVEFPSVLIHFDEEGLRLAHEIIEIRQSDLFIVRRLLKEVVEPQINHIDFETGYANSPDYFAWRLLHTLRGMR